MKSILYVGAGLMMAAGIYGFADYSKASEKKEFNSLYEKKTETLGSGEMKLVGAAVNLINLPEVIDFEEYINAPGPKGKKLNYKLFSRAEL